MKHIKLKRKNNLIGNQGITLIEMIVSFALLAIFLASAAMIIATITTMYYDVKGENYARQVSDIVLNKIESEIDGAKYISGEDEINLRIQTAGNEDTDENLNSGAAVLLTDKTGTNVKIYNDTTKKDIVIHYFPIGKQNETDWRFDESVYNHFTVEDLKFVKGSNLSEFLNNNSDYSTDYGLTNPGTYGDDVIVVFLKINSGRYGDYYAYRFVKMYNYTATP